MKATRQSLKVVSAALHDNAAHFPVLAKSIDLSDWTNALQFANNHLLTAAMHAALAKAGTISMLPADVHDYLSLLHDANTERNVALRSQALELIEALSSAHVPTVLLKGALSLFLDHYPDIGARMFRDIDVLVRAEDLEPAIAVLEHIGYKAETRYQPVQHAYAEFTREGSPGAVDLHIELIDANYILPRGEIWDRAVPMMADGIFFSVPAAGDRVFHNILHAQVHHLGNYYRGNLKLQQIFDLTRLAAASDAAIDWSFIAERMRRHRLLPMLESYLLAANTLFGLPWPALPPASMASRLNFKRGLAQLYQPLIGTALLPWANLRSAFAAHRMEALYGNVHRPLAIRQIHHAIAFMQKSTPKDLVARLFKQGI